MVIVVVLTFVITLSVGFLTEYVRQSMTFLWGIEVGDEFVYDVSVTGNTTTGTQVLPPPLEPMNNTRIIVEIISLPNLTLYYDGTSFIEDVVEHLKTTSRFDDGSDIPNEFYFPINTHASGSILPTGAWGHLDSLFPNQVNRTIPGQETFMTISGTNSFFFGYWLNETTHESEWHGIIDLSTGMPIVFSFSIWREGQPWIYSYTVTMTLVT
jgi:hypothetical protein